MNSIRVIILEILITIFIGAFSSFLYVQNIAFFEKLNSKFTDLFFELRGDKYTSNDIVIVNIDDKTLGKLGSFSRDKMAKMIDNLSDAGAKVIAVDMVFSEFDSSSPKRVLNKLSLKSDLSVDYDEVLAKSFGRIPVVLGYIFSFNSDIKRGEIPNTNYIVVQKNYIGIEFLPTAKGIVSNITLLQNSAYSSGFFNIIADDDGIVRSLPLLIKYEDSIYSSLVLEVIGYLKKAKQVVIDYSEAGIDDVRLGDFEILTDRFGRLMLDFKGKSKSYRYINALDIYGKNFDKNSIKDKIVLIGKTSANGHMRATPIDSTFANVEIIANAIDNIINQDFLMKPNWIEAVDIGVVYVILVLMLLFSLMGPFKNALFSLLVVCGFLYMVFYLFVHYGLILNIIFPLISSFILYLILTFLHYVNETKQRDILNNKLISHMNDRQKIIEQKVEEKTNALQMALEEKNTLFRELHHRVKNNLQLILSITRLQQHNIQDKESIKEFKKLSGRIKSIAKTHEILCDSGHVSNVDMSEYIGELCEEMQSGIGDRSIEIIQDIYASMSLAQAVYVGLIVNELVSNSFKHAFDENGGEIYIYISKEGNEYLLKIGDNGKGCKEESNKQKTLGLKLVDSLVMNQLDGSIRISESGKYRYVIKFSI